MTNTNTKNRFVQRILILAGLFLPGFGAFGQYVEYDPSKLSEKNRQKIVELENYIRDSIATSSDLNGIYITGKLNQVDLKANPAELAMLVNHPNAQIRYSFLDWYIARQVKSGNSALLFNYLQHYLLDQTSIHYQRGCIIGEVAFGSYCYDEIERHLAPGEKQAIRKQLIESGIPSGPLESLIERLPENDSSYRILEKLVYEKKVITALRPLLSYGNEKDTAAPYLFLPKHRREVQTALFMYFHPAYERYLREDLAGFLSDDWSDDEYNVYALLIDKCSEEKSTPLLQFILDALDENKVYKCANSLYFAFKDNGPLEAQDRLALALFQSLDSPDTALVEHLRTIYPKQFEEKLEQRLLLMPDPYMDYAYNDSSFTHFLLRDYIATKSEHKIEVYRKLVNFSFGPVLIEAVLQLKDTHRKEVVSILEKRHAEMVKLHTVERPEQPHYKYGLSIYEALWMESIRKAMVYLDDEALTKRVAPVIAGYLGDPGAGNFDEFAKTLLKSADDPALYEHVLQKVETQPFEYSYNSAVGFLLDLNDKSYGERLKNRYLELKKTADSNTLFRFRIMLQEAGYLSAQ